MRNERFFFTSDSFFLLLYLHSNESSTTAIYNELLEGGGERAGMAGQEILKRYSLYILLRVLKLVRRENLRERSYLIIVPWRYSDHVCIEAPRPTVQSGVIWRRSTVDGPTDTTRKPS